MFEPEPFWSHLERTVRRYRSGGQTIGQTRGIRVVDCYIQRPGLCCVHTGEPRKVSFQVIQARIASSLGTFCAVTHIFVCSLIPGYWTFSEKNNDAPFMRMDLATISIVVCEHISAILKIL